MGLEQQIFPDRAVLGGFLTDVVEAAPRRRADALAQSSLASPSLAQPCLFQPSPAWQVFIRKIVWRIRAIKPTFRVT